MVEMSLVRRWQHLRRPRLLTTEKRSDGRQVCLNITNTWAISCTRVENLNAAGASSLLVLPVEKMLA